MATQAPHNGNGSTKVLRWAQIIGTGAAAVAGTVGILWYIFSAANDIRVQASRNTEFDRRLALIETALNTIQSNVSSITGDGRSQVTQIAEFQRRLEANGTSIAALYVAAAEVKRDLNEIETQFCEADHLRNLTHATDMRWISLLFEKTFGAKVPTDNAYYPTVCNRRLSTR